MLVFLASVTHLQDDTGCQLLQHKQNVGQELLSTRRRNKVSSADRYPCTNAARMGGIQKHGN